MEEQSKDAVEGSAKTIVQWERETLERLAFATLKEQKLQRRWGIFFKCVFIFLILFGAYHFGGFFQPDADNSARHTALVEINGEIETEGSGSAHDVIPALDRAFAESGSVGVMLRINSPGGSPVQAGMINDEIVRLRQQYPDKKLYVVVEEMCTSGGYYIAAAADKIFVNKASVVGSIGVLTDGFGFTGLMSKLGVERRLMTAGENKGFMDPYSPITEKHKAYSQAMLNEIHQQFIDVVKKGRGKRLKETPEIFSGLFWVGSKAVEMGLADDFGTIDSVARDVIKAEDIVDYTQKEDLPERVLKKFGASVGSAAMATVSRSGRFTLH